MLHPRSFTPILLVLAALAPAYRAHPAPPSGEFRVRIVSGPKERGDVQKFELATSRRALLTLKDRLGRDALLQTLQPEIDFANAAWHDILANSSGGHIPSEARLEATGLDAASFVAWFAADTGDPHKMLAAHPEHFIEEATVVNGTTSVHAVENWGPLITRYTVPDYGDNPRMPWMRELPDFPFQSIGDTVLVDGTVIGNVHHAFRNEPRGGMIAVVAVWLPDSTPDDIVEGLSEHLAVEFANWMTAAHEDIASGKFTPQLD